jgi:hypothetical protein
MRYRIVLEIDTDEPRIVVNQLAQRLYNEAVTKYSNPVFLSTEKVDNTVEILTFWQQQ